MPPNLFGVAWEQLDASAVEQFLVQAGDEGLTWEAKGGGDRPRPDTIRKSACGFANTMGGYLIVGAERGGDGTWTLPGVDFRGEESATWLSTMVAGDGGVVRSPRTTRGLSTAPAVEAQRCSRSNLWQPSPA